MSDAVPSSFNRFLDAFRHDIATETTQPLAEYLERVVTDAELRGRLAAGAYAVAQAHSCARSVARALDLYDVLASEGRE